MGLVSLLMNLIFIVGLVLITISLTKAYNTTSIPTPVPVPIPTQPPQSVIPRPSFIAPTPSQIFNDMVSGFPWVSGINVTRDVTDISQNPNKYGISQF
ncbi:putative ORFan [Tupanvirus deep ocean]|uniref:ORFan n=2 Tax=Tupanvirus TaxID=2094720 RepID=A0AC62A8X1_9VIRU|nr:putative ORFan [Tupanvirus deep ocean]QKU34093.1 putative ORFan [Tupanvirus deep ocean]